MHPITSILPLLYLSSRTAAHDSNININAAHSSAASDYTQATPTITSILSLAPALTDSDISNGIQDIPSLANSVYSEATKAIDSILSEATSEAASVGDDITSLADAATSAVGSFGKIFTSGVRSVVSEVTQGVESIIGEATASTAQTMGTSITVTKAVGSATGTPTSILEGKVRRRGRRPDSVLAAAVFAAVAFL